MNFPKISKNFSKNFFFDKKNLKIFWRKKKLENYSLFNEITLIKCFHKIKIKNNSSLGQCSLQTYVRNKNSLFFSLRKKQEGNIMNLFFSREQVLSRFDNHYDFLLISYMTKENIERYRKEFLEKLFLCLEKIKSIKIKLKKKVSVIIIPNQTSLLQIIRHISIINKKDKIKLSESRFYEKNFLRIKFGKLVKPADNRLNFTDGDEDFINIKCFLKKNKIQFSIKNINADFFFLSPLFLRSLSTLYLKELFANLFYCLIDNFGIIIMQNSENFSLILKTFFYKKKDQPQISEIFNFYQKKKFQLLFSFDYFFSPISLSLNIPVYSFASYEKNYQNEKNFKFSKFKNNVYLEYEISQKIHPNKQRFIVFKKKLSFFILTNINKKTLLFCKKYTEYVLLRNHIMKISQKKDIIFIMLNEYLNFSELTRRKNFGGEKKKIILVTERYYYYHRSIVSLISNIFFYSFPYNWEFFLELVITETKNTYFKKVYSLVSLGEFYR